jgi:hypothetical protein
VRVYEKHPTADAYRVGASFTPYAIVAKDKRFSGAELAAEYYRSAFLHENSLSENDGYDGMPETRAHRYQATMLWRFATAKAYDE